MGGRLAYGVDEISTDPADLDKPGFWAVTSTFEGEWICARFSHIIDSAFPDFENEWETPAGKWSTSQSETEYIDVVKQIQKRISLGWVYQVNACRELAIPIEPGTSLAPLMLKLLAKNPAPYASYLQLPGISIASASPELLLKRNGTHVLSAPIKGTMAPTATPVEFSVKDQAENVMIVDLIRNDLGRVCVPGSVDVPRLLATEEHPGVTHLVSDVSGQLLLGISWLQISDALMPPGSVSGAPKSSAVETIAALEKTERGPYCGALGWSQGTDALLSVAIRIFWSKNDGVLRFGTGAGITWGSDAQSEWEETQLKASRLVGIAGGDFDR